MSLNRKLPQAALVAVTLALGACAGPTESDDSSEQRASAADTTDGVLFGMDGVKEIALTIDPADMAAMTEQAHGVQADPGRLFEKRIKGKGTFRVASGGTACDTTKDHAISLKIKGMASVRGFDSKPSLKIDFDKPFCGLKNLALNNMVQDTTMVNEALAYKMYESMGVPVPRLGYSVVTINGQPFGVYLTLETIDKRFLARTFGDGTGPIYEGVYGGDFRSADVGTRTLEFQGDDENPEAQGFGQMHHLIAAIQAPGDDVFYGPAPLVDVNEFVSMMATAYVIGDWDNYVTANNYRVYRSPTTQLWSFIPTGTDQTFAARLHPFQGAGRAPTVLFDKCLSSPRCSAEYVQALARAVAKLQEPEGTLAGTAARRAALIEAAVRLDGRRPQTDEMISATRDSLAAFLRDRPAEIASALAIPAVPSQCGLLLPGEGLIPGRAQRSCDGRYTLALQASDGNIVLYRNDGTPLWASATAGAVALFVQGDGNLVAYGPGQTPLWSSGTPDQPGALFAVQDDGNLVGYLHGEAFWASETVNQ